MKRLTILVTGCGGDISQSMGKILKDYQGAERVLGCDLHNDHAGHFIFHECFVVERASSPLYLDTMTRLIDQQQVDIMIPATEYELEFLLKNGIDRIGNCCLIKPDNRSIEIGLDKYKTAKFLEAQGFPYPKTFLLSELKEPLIPCVIKERRGSGSKSVQVVKDQETFALVSRLIKDAICQQYLDADDQEFTCGLFRTKSGMTRSIIFRRKLTGGFSGFGVVESNEAISDLLQKMASALDLTGSINVQLRLYNGIPLVFEINARFSSTVLFRHLLGFHDLIWSIEEALGMPLQAYVPPREGSRFYKGFQEYIVKS